MTRKKEITEGSTLSKTIVYGIFGNLCKLFQIFDIVYFLAGVTPGVKDFIAEAVEGQISLQSVFLRQNKVSDSPGLWL